MIKKRQKKSPRKKKQVKKNKVFKNILSFKVIKEKLFQKARPKIIALCFFIVLFFVFFFLILFSQKQDSKIVFDKGIKNKTIEEKKCVDCKQRMIDGVYVEAGKENIFPVSIIVDNHFRSWPSLGLSKANIVYEVPVEGGITRYLAVLASDESFEKIGPVRSARPYFIDLVQEFGALFMHCGGSPEALVQISKQKILDVNEFYKSRFFWRERARIAPHNIFTSKEKIDKYLDTIEGEASFSSWLFKDEEKEKNKDAENIKIGFKKPYNVLWEYDKENNDYIRHLGEETHLDGDKKIKAKNLIIHYIDTKVIDSELRLRINLVGKGDALLCIDGKCRKGEWQKLDKETRTRYYIDGEEVLFNRGNFWIEMINPGVQIKIST